MSRAGNRAAVQIAREAVKGISIGFVIAFFYKVFNSM